MILKSIRASFITIAILAAIGMIINFNSQIIDLWSIVIIILSIYQIISITKYISKNID